MKNSAELLFSRLKKYKTIVNQTYYFGLYTMLILSGLALISYLATNQAVAGLLDILIKCGTYSLVFIMSTNIFYTKKVDAMYQELALLSPAKLFELH